MLRTILLLIIALIIVPLVAFYIDDPLTTLQQTMLRTAAIMTLGVAMYCFIVSELVRNYSQVDKLWSIVPLLYGWYFASASNWEPRIVLMAILISIWGARLTYNFSRRGAYQWKFWAGEEDYRWAILRQQPHLNTRLKWGLFNLFFICLYQNGLILLFTLPAVMAAGSGNGITIADIVLAIISVGFVVMEYIADQQQWNFQKEKYRRINNNEPLTEPYSDGFVSSGLWKYFRHPNYTAEQAIWVVFYLFSVSATGKWLNWSIAGCVLLMLLFQGSADFSEKISAGKYPKYKEYQKRVGRFFPKLF